MTSKDAGTVGKLVLASQAIYATHVLSEPIPTKTLQDSIDPTYLKQYVSSHK